MVRIFSCLSLLLTLALPRCVASADDMITANQLESLNAAVAGAALGSTTVVALVIGGLTVDYSVVVDSLGNITATAPVSTPPAEIQTIAIASTTSATGTNVPLTVTVITAAGGITSFNIGTDIHGNITSVTNTNTVLTTANTTQAITSSSTSTSGGTGTGTVTDAITSTSTLGGGGTTTGTVIVTFAPGTSVTTATVVSPH